MSVTAVVLFIVACLLIALGRRWTWRAQKRGLPWQRRYTGWGLIFLGILVMTVAVLLW